MHLMKDIKQFDVPRNQVGVWWLGQNGFIFKTPEGTLLSIDLYLTNSVPGIIARSACGPPTHVADIYCSRRVGNRRICVHA